MNPFHLSSRLSVSARSVAGERGQSRAAGGGFGGVRREVVPRAPDPGGGKAGITVGAAVSSADSSPPSSAVPVPWRVVVRSESGVIEVEHCGETPLHAVRFSLAGSGMLGLSLPRTVFPGERMRVVLRGSGAGAASSAADAVLVLRWFQPDGRELLWPIPL